MHILTISETVFPGAELQVSLRIAPGASADFLHTSSPQPELEDVSCEALDSLRRYMAAIALKLPELIAAGSVVLEERRLAQLQMQNAQLSAQLASK